ncbi:MAG: HEAT repeat domain-containing protein [Calditrichae bacterium]|nr:HEAT repeat domain-containing protein [Calditrichia bacterium]
MHIPDFDFDGMNFNFNRHWDYHAPGMFKNLTEQEELRLEALRSVVRKGSDREALAALEKVLKGDDSPALRYEAVRQLEHFTDEEAAIKLLGDAAKNDSHVKVRKKAIQVLGRSGDPRAVEILEEVIREN